MKKLPLFMLMLMICLSTVAQKNNQSGDQDKNQKNQNQETRITPGASGVKRSIGYRFSSQVTDEDPGNGVFRINSESVAKATYMIVDDLDVSGENQSKWYSTWDDTTGATGRGQITLVESEGKGILKYDVSGVFVDASGFWKIPVKHVSGTMPVNGAIYYYVFERIDHKKDKTQTVPPTPDNNIAQVVPPVEPPKPVEEVKPIEPPTPVEEVKPVEPPKPVEEVKPIDTPTPVEEVKPVEPPKPVEEVKPIEPPKPVEEVKPVEPPKPVEEVKPVEPPKPVEEMKPVEPPKPVEEVKTVEPPKPAEETKPVEQPRPAEEVKPVEQPKPVAEVKPVEQPAPVTEVKPAEQPKPTEEVKPEPVRQQTERQPVRREQAAAKPSATEQTAAATTQPEQRTGTTWTSRVTQGAETAQNPPPANQYNQGSQTGQLPTYQYRYSTNKRGRGKWYAGIIEAGYGLGVGEYGIDNFRLNFINGFHLGQTFSAGLGIGVRRYYVERENFTDHSLVSGKVQVPIFLDLRKTFSTRTVTPYLALGIGNSVRYSAGDTTNVKEGLLFNPSGGIWFNLSSRFAVFCGVAYEMQKMEYLLIADDSRYKKNTSSISLNIGIAF